MALDYYTALDTGQPSPYLSRNTEGRGVMVGYCFKCKAKRSLKDAVQVKMRNGRVRTQGLCQVCNTRISTLGKA